MEPIDTTEKARSPQTVGAEIEEAPA